MNDSLYIKGATVSLPQGSTRCDVVVENGRVTGLPRRYANMDGLPELDAEGLTVLPGFIDVHTHGAAGVDVNAADEEGLRTIGRFFASQGVTGWLCSVLTDTPRADALVHGAGTSRDRGWALRRRGAARHPLGGALPVQRVQGRYARAPAHARGERGFLHLPGGLGRPRALHHPRARDPRRRTSSRS